MHGRFVFTFVLLAAALLAGAVGVNALVANGNAAPEFAEGAWINTQPLTMQGLRGRVVLIDFWTFG